MQGPSILLKAIEDAQRMINSHWRCSRALVKDWSCINKVQKIISDLKSEKIMVAKDVIEKIQTTLGKDVLSKRVTRKILQSMDQRVKNCCPLPLPSVVVIWSELYLVNVFVAGRPCFH